MATAARTHRAATKTVGRDTAPSIIAAQHIKTAMAGMDAAEAAALLGKPARIPQMLQIYEARRLEASKALIAAAENITYGDQERLPIQTIEVGLGNYAELAQRARDMHDVAAYREAADLADSKLYPAADALDKANRDALDRIYENQLSYSLATRTSVVITGLLLLFTLLSVQSFLTRRMRRIFNPPLVLASIIAFAMLAYSVERFQLEMSQLKVAKQDAFESIDALWRARAVAYEASADQIRYLLDDAGAKQYDDEFQAKAGETRKYLDAELKNITFEGEREAANDTDRFFKEFLGADQEIRRTKTVGKKDAAIALCLDGAPFQAFDEALGRTLDINQKAFHAAVLEGEHILEYFQTKAVLACLAIALLSLVGLLGRIQEYR